MSHLFLTGASGSVGVPLLKRLLTVPAIARVTVLARTPSAISSDPKVRVIKGDLESLSEIPAGTTHIIHAAACTEFSAPCAQLNTVNVRGTEHILDLARSLPNLVRILHISTTCVAGDREGLIPESALPHPDNFLNDYERSKWLAEQACDSATDLPLTIIRLATIIGNQTDGRVERAGAFHHLLRWMARGLLPMLPASRNAHIDLISCEHACEIICACLNQASPAAFLHASNGAAAPSIDTLLGAIADDYRQIDDAWKRGIHSAPEPVDQSTWNAFEDSIKRSGDLLFTRILETSRSFLPALLHPRQLATGNSTSIPGARTDWRALLKKVIPHHIPS